MDAGCRVRVALFFVFVTLGASSRGFAQIDLAGQWRPLLHEDIGHRLDEASAAPGISGAGGPWIGDYTGLPINAAARYKAESWDPRIDSAKERQTILQPGAYWIFSLGLQEFADKVGLPLERHAAERRPRNINANSRVDLGHQGSAIRDRA
jgi:hypothetical protein